MQQTNKTRLTKRERKARRARLAAQNVIMVQGQSINRKGPLVVNSGGNIDVFTPSPSKTIREMVTYNAIISSDGTGAINARFSLRNLTQALDGSGTYVDAADFGSLFDMYKPLHLNVELIPLFPRGTTKCGALISCVDFDFLPGNIVGFANCLNYDNRRTLDAVKNNAMDVNIKPLTEGTSTNPDGDGRSAVPIHAGGWLDLGNPPEEGILYVSGTNFVANTQYYHALCTMTIELRYKR